MKTQTALRSAAFLVIGGQRAGKFAYGGCIVVPRRGSGSICSAILLRLQLFAALVCRADGQSEFWTRTCAMQHCIATLYGILLAYVTPYFHKISQIQLQTPQNVQLLAPFVDLRDIYVDHFGRKRAFFWVAISV
jgi:hypothetical protein